MTHCPFCKRKPEETEIIVESAKFDGEEPAEWVRELDSTYHSQTDMFCCDDCYIEQGFPLMIDLVRAYNEFAKEKPTDGNQ
ncbi:hypothetical protein [Oceanobacillus neutriphilus]|uniref:Uncharacterized protein n=1 Tax=Oceanobacillus neutriphilus TaxID=531815 RepID=A0ABQ2NP22_9BACI|nr:hypothetical protein [Oceanobacillus neutriphilus]GGP07344.1 hypothetical protein GCM10011346_02960 [Oceanobacillus neutriphilus]